MPHTSPISPFSLDTLPINPASPWLAPLAGWSDAAFRLLCRELGATVTCTEMVSAKGLVYNGRNTEALLASDPADTPLVVQLFGEDPVFIARAVTLLKERGFTWFDLNMGCSVPKVTKTGAGAAMLKDFNRTLDVASAFFEAASAKGSPRAGVKIRLGWEKSAPAPQGIQGSQAPQKDLEACAAFMLGLASRGAAFITLHPRYARQGFTGLADRQAFGFLARELGHKVPLIASGDIYSVEDAREYISLGASSVMYARGAMARPFIFAEHKAAFATPPEPLPHFSPTTLKSVILRHAELLRQYCPNTKQPEQAGRPDLALVRMRTFVPRYIKEMEGAKHLRLALNQCQTWGEFEELVDEALGGKASLASLP